jgi:cytosine/adenosine deaminase-related metal-dependent hydrolase
MRTLFKQATLVPMGGVEAALPNKDVLVDGDRIAAVGEAIDPATVVHNIVDARDKLILPGLINAHYHSHNNYFRGCFDSYPLDACVLHLWSLGVPAEVVRLTPRQLYARTLLGCAEMLRTGTTTVIDDVNLLPWLDEESVEAVLQAYRDAGIRAVVALHVFDIPYLQSMPFVEQSLPTHLKNKLQAIGAPDTQAILKTLEACSNRWGGDHGRVRLGLGPSGPQRCSDHLILECARLASKFDMPIYIHLLESRTQPVIAKLKYGKTLVRHLYDLQVLGPRVSLGHAVWITTADIEILARTGVTVCHNPISNLKLGSGIAPIQRLLENNVPIALGTDGVMSNDSLNMFESMKFAALLHKVRDPNPQKWLGAREALRMATAGGCQSCRHSAIGEIKAGARADLIVLNLKTASFAPRNDLLLQSVYAENGSSVDMVMIDGRVVVQNGRHTTLNETALVEEVCRDAAEFHERTSSKEPKWAAQLVPYFVDAFRKCWSVDVGTEAFGPHYADCDVTPHS